MTEDRLRARKPVLLADSGDRYLGAPVVIHGCDADRWLQYWIAYPADPDHPGIDWEMVMLREQDGAIAEAAYARHRTARRQPASGLLMHGSQPCIFVGRDKHASYFRPGWYRHGLHLERANGKLELDAALMLGVPDPVRGRVAHRDPDRWLSELGV